MIFFLFYGEVEIIDVYAPPQTSFTCKAYMLGVGKVMGSMVGPSRVIAKDVICATLIVWVRGMPWTQTGATQYHAQLGLLDKGCAIKGLVVCNNWDLEPLDLLNGLVLGRLLSTVLWGINRIYIIFTCNNSEAVSQFKPNIRGNIEEF